MVTTDFSQKLTRHLELYLWQLNGFSLPVCGYDLLLLLPISPDSWSDKRTLLLSSSALFKQSRWETTHGILAALRNSLEEDEYLSLFNVDLIEPTAYVVQQVKRYVKSRADGEIEAPISLIGGVTNQFITAIKSTVLDKLALNQSYEVKLLHEAAFEGEITSLSPLNNDHSDVQLVCRAAGKERSFLYSALEQLNRIAGVGSASVPFK